MKIAPIACRSLLLSCALPWASMAEDPLPPEESAEEIDAALTRTVEPSVVAILHERAGGSGSVLTSDGYILSNGHVVMKPEAEDPRKTAEKITVVLHDERKYKARVIGHSLDPDVSLLKIDLEPGVTLAPARIADSRKAQVGQKTIAAGMPSGLKQTYTKGIFSNVERTSLGTFTKVFQTDAAINPGNSGGPLFNERGEVLGLNTYGGGGEAMGFTIPIHFAMVLKDHFLKYGRFRRATLPGLLVQEIYPEMAQALGVEEGILVDFVEPGSASEKAGFRDRDVIVKLDGVSVSARTEAQLLDFIWGMTTREPGSTVEAGILRRNGERWQEHVICTTLEEDEPRPKYGYQLGEIPEHRFEDLGLGVQRIVSFTRWLKALPDRPGVFVSTVLDNSPSAKAGLQGNTGDIVTAVDGKAVATPETFVAAIEEACGACKKAIVLDVVRKNLTIKTALAPFYELAGKRVALVVPSKDAEHLDLIRRFLTVNGAEIAAAADDLDSADAILLVGGNGASEYWNDTKVHDGIRKALAANKTIGAIGAASVTLASADRTLIDKKVKITTHEDFSKQLTDRKANNTGNDVESDGKVITTTGSDRDKVKEFLKRFRASITQGR